MDNTRWFCSRHRRWARFFRSKLVPIDHKLDEDQLKFLENIDAILLGRKTYGLFKDFWPAASVESEIIADKLNSIEKFVFSNTLENAPWGKWRPANVVDGDAMGRIPELKMKEGRDMVIWGSISLVQSLLKEGLIDEIHLFVCPILLGTGRSLFVPGINKQNLVFKDARHYETGNVFLSYKI